MDTIAVFVVHIIINWKGTLCKWHEEEIWIWEICTQNTTWTKKNVTFVKISNSTDLNIPEKNAYLPNMNNMGKRTCMFTYYEKKVNQRLTVKFINSDDSKCNFSSMNYLYIQINYNEWISMRKWRTHQHDITHFLGNRFQKILS